MQVNACQKLIFSYLQLHISYADSRVNTDVNIIAIRLREITDFSVIWIDICCLYVGRRLGFFNTIYRQGDNYVIAKSTLNSVMSPILIT